MKLPLIFTLSTSFVSVQAADNKDHISSPHSITCKTTSLKNQKFKKIPFYLADFFNTNAPGVDSSRVSSLFSTSFVRLRNMKADKTPQYIRNNLADLDEEDD